MVLESKLENDTSGLVNPIGYATTQISPKRKKRKKLIKRLAIGALLIGGILSSKETNLNSCGYNTIALRQRGIPMWGGRYSFDPKRDYYGGFLTLSGFGQRVVLKNSLDFANKDYLVFEYQRSSLNHKVSTSIGSAYTTKHDFTITHDSSGFHTDNFHNNP